MKVNITTSYYELVNEANRKYTPLADALRKELLEKWKNHQKDVQYEEPRLYALSGRAGEGNPKAIHFQYYINDTPQIRQQLKEFAHCMEFGIVKADNEAVIEPKMVYDAEFEFYRPNDKMMLAMKEQLREIVKEAGVPIEVDFIKDMEGGKVLHTRFAFYDTREIANCTGVGQYNSIFLDPQKYTLPQIANAVVRDYVKNPLEIRMEEARREGHYQIGKDFSLEQEKAMRQDMMQVQRDFGKFAVVLNDCVYEHFQQQFRSAFEPSWMQQHVKRLLSMVTASAYVQGVDEKEVMKVLKVDSQKAIYDHKNLYR